MLEELYRLDFPRPEASRVGGAAAAPEGAFGGLSPAALSDMLGSGEAREMLDQLQRNPQAMQQRMKDEFRRMSPDEQRQLIDMLSASGMGDRDFWERFFRGL